MIIICELCKDRNWGYENSSGLSVCKECKEKDICFNCGDIEERDKMEINPSDNEVVCESCFNKFYEYHKSE